MIDPLPYEDYITVTRSTSQQDPTTGLATATETQVLTCPCDVQDDSFALRRTRQGDGVLEADAAIYLPERLDITPLRKEDRVTVEYAHVLQEGQITEISHYEHRILVRWT